MLSLASVFLALAIKIHKKVSLLYARHRRMVLETIRAANNEKIWTLTLFETFYK